MYARIGKAICVHDPTFDFVDWCERNLTIENPDYIKKQRMGLWTGNTPLEISLYEKRGEYYVVPFGCHRRLREAFPDMQVVSYIKKGAGYDYEPSIDLYPYQEEAVASALEKKNGIIVMPCGAGKTQVGLELVARLGLRTLWLTHTQDLLNQSMNRAKALYNCKPSAFGTITGGKVNVGEGITFATVQTMSRLDLASYSDVWGCVVVDECHRAVGSPTRVHQFYKVLSNLRCRYKFGLTATPKRADGLEVSMFSLLGDVVCAVEKDAVASNTCPVKVRRISTGYFPDVNVVLSGDGTLDYASLVDDLTHDEGRFSCVVEFLKSIHKGEPSLVLGNRVEYLERLSVAMGKSTVCLSGAGTSKRAKEERKAVLGRLNRGEIDMVFATYQLAKEGLDVPNLRYLVMATPEKDETTVAQSAGRVGRKAEGKEFGTVIDFRDAFGMYVGWGKKRDTVYKKLGYDILEME